MTLNQLRMHNIAPRGIRGTCAPTSICFATGASYYDVEEVLLREQPGNYRPDIAGNRGVDSIKLFGAERKLFGHKFTRDLFPAMTIRYFVSRWKTGTYLLVIPRHMLVIQNGEIFDLNNTNLNSIVLAKWMVEKI
jgi:hypothetical protein